jgi:predicted membrane-bound spermidine synthase
MLGHPTYGLSVILFALLLSSGMGSYLTSRIAPEQLRAAGVRRLGVLLALLLAFGILTPHGITLFSGAVTPVRVFVAVAMLFPMGLFMGMAFPIGMKLAAGRAGDLIPWLWGVNGATSVCASAVAVVISLSFSISTAYWTGFACYLFALLALHRRRARQELRIAAADQTTSHPA